MKIKIKESTETKNSWSLLANAVANPNRYVKFSEDNQIVPDLFSIEYDSDDYYDVLADRNEYAMNIIENYSQHYLAVIKTDDYIEVVKSQFIDWTVEHLAIKEGVDYYKLTNIDGFCIRAYYGRSTDDLYLFALSDEQANELSKFIDESDFDENYTIQGFLSQYAH